MYAFRSTPGLPGQMLIEISAADFRAATSANPPEWAKGRTFRRIGAATAHAWVKGAGSHETALYLGEDAYGRPRIRYARDGF